jgi:hypothetical protein
MDGKWVKVSGDGPVIALGHDTFSGGEDLEHSPNE